jgi:hypothetical protein
MSESKRISFAAAKLPGVNATPATQSVVVTSRGYSEQEKGWPDIASNWRCIATADEICWHDPDYTESAFSSAEIYREILESFARSAE